METAIGEQTRRAVSARSSTLNIIGNLGPLLGLLGTVLGMIVAFSAMKAAGGQRQPGRPGGWYFPRPLCHTFEGLALGGAVSGVLRHSAKPSSTV